MSDKQSWPAWFFGPDNQQQIFQSEDEVPEGWHDHPSKVAKVEPTVDPTKLRSDINPYEGLSEEQLRAEMDAKGITYGAKWGRGKLVAVLRANTEA